MQTGIYRMGRAGSTRSTRRGTCAGRATVQPTGPSLRQCCSNSASEPSKKTILPLIEALSPGSRSLKQGSACMQGWSGLPIRE